MRDVLRASLVRCSARSLDCLHWALSAPSIKSMELDAFRSDLSTNWRENIMKAFIIDHYGSNDGVRAGEMPDPELRDDDVLVQIHAASVNPLDFKIRDGKLKLILPYRLPFILGNDLAGVVVRVGSRVRRFKPGDEVYARTDKDRIGSFAEFISIKEDAVAIKPKKLTMEEAASIPLVGLTAWQALIERANLKKGLRVLIHAGSGGVGTFAIQLAKHVGAIVATTTSTENLDWVKRLGADIVIDYRKDDFETILHDYDVVFDTLGGEVLEKSIRVLKPGGKLISIAGLPDSDFAKELGLSRILRLVMYFMSYRIREKAKRHHVSYSFLFMRPSGDQLREIGSLIDSGIIRPVVDRVFPFESTKEALAYVEKGRAKGKVIVKVR
jgi:NADPH:quinone reductase-like Zn-dependent oxidoreductase